jgi:hypothetical protein
MAIKLQWAPGSDDVQLLRLQDPSGFFVGTLDNKIIGCISAVKQGSSLGFVGYYIVDEAFRRQVRF